MCFKSIYVNDIYLINRSKNNRQEFEDFPIHILFHQFHISLQNHIYCDIREVLDRGPH